jgi:O-antigen/teichoic acid export membrane protein
MNKFQLIAKNIGFLLLSQIITVILSFLYIIYIARYLGTSGFGILSFALAFTGIFVVLVDLGLNMLTVREVSRDKLLAGRYLGNTILIKIILTLITLFLIFSIVKIIKYPQETIDVVYLIGFSVIFGSFSGIFNSIFQAYEKMEYQSFGQIINSFLMFAGVLIAIYYGLGLYAFASIYFIVSIIVLIYSFFVCSWKFALPKIEIDLNFWMFLIFEALPFGLTSIFVLIYYYMDTVMLSILIPNSNAIIGLYSAAYRLVMPLSFVPAIFFSSVFPVMSNFYGKSEQSLNFAFGRSIRYMAIFGIPIATGITILANKIILLIYGEAYFPSVIALQILIWTVPLIFIDSAFAYLFSSINKQATIAKIMGIVAFFNILLNIILIPIYSYIGASIVTLASDLITLPLMMFVLSNTQFKVPFTLLKDVMKVFISSMAMLIPLIILNDLNIFIIILISSLVYVATFLSLKGLDDEDIKIIKNIIPKKINRK